MINNINNREKQSKNIVITLGKNSGEYHFISDSLSERSKIKIPITPTNKKDSKLTLGASSETDQIKEKK